MSERLTDYERVTIGLGFLNDHVDLLDGMGITCLQATPSRVCFHVDAHAEARRLAAALTAATGITLTERTSDSDVFVHLTFEAEYALGESDDRGNRLNVEVIALEEHPEAGEPR